MTDRGLTVKVCNMETNYPSMLLSGVNCDVSLAVNHGVALRSYWFDFELPASIASEGGS